ncbi:MAG: hypothetical protein KA126_04630 [Candidatus Hydrothermae bacterium]|nr:hypothetical protein [Candidatus Hydrothermae bacterium]MDD3649211.1 acyl-CoA reductase [Candidatus Hydrothermia bacterium]
MRSLLDNYLRALEEFFIDYQNGKVPSDISYQKLLIEQILQKCIECTCEIGSKGSFVKGPEKVFVFLPGNVPVVMFQIMPVLLLSGVRDVFFKFSSKEGKFQECFIGYLKRHFKDCLQVSGDFLSHEESLSVAKQYDFIIGFGGEELGQKLGLLGKPYRFFGPKFSIGILWSEPSISALENIAFDNLSFDTRGCLSMKFLLTPWEGFEDQLFTCFSVTSRELFPMSDFDMDQSEYEVLRHSLEVQRIVKGGDFFLLFADKLVEIDAARTLVVVKFKDVSELESIIYPYKDFIQGIATDGYYPSFTSCSYVAKFGELQFPPCGWYFENGIILDNFWEVKDV